MFNSETTLAGIPTVACEAPGQGQCRAEDVATYTDGLMRLLRHRGMCPGEPVSPTREPAICPTEILAGADGLFITDVEVGEHVTGGQRLGRVTDAFGEVRAEVCAPHAGEVWALRTFASVYAHEYVVWVAPSHREAD
jgi:predicted deacylase